MLFSSAIQKCDFQEKKIQVYPTISLNNVQVERVSYQKHLDILLDDKPTRYFDNKKLRHNLPRKSLVIIYKDFLRPQSFCEKIESVLYKATLATGTIQGTSRDKIYQELGLESLKLRRWYKSLVCMFKIMNEKAPNYLTNLNPKNEPTIRIRNNSV